METSEIPSWFAHLEEEDQQFIKRLVLASGSLKELAEIYDVSYPTLRLRLDRLIERIRVLDAPASSDPFQAKIRLLVADGEISPKLGKELLQIHKTSANGGKK
jgi:hypothetical protein